MLEKKRGRINTFIRKKEIPQLVSRIAFNVLENNGKSAKKKHNLFKLGLQIKKTYPACNFNVSKLNCLLPMGTHNCCRLHRLNVCGMQCTSYYIGYLHYMKAGCRDEDGYYTKIYSCSPACHTP